MRHNAFLPLFSDSCSPRGDGKAVLEKVEESLAGVLGLVQLDFRQGLGQDGVDVLPDIITRLGFEGGRRRGVAVFGVDVGVRHCSKDSVGGLEGGGCVKRHNF